MKRKLKTSVPPLRMLLTLCLGLLLVCGGRAQERKLQYKPYIDLRKFHYGFFIGVHNEMLHLLNNGYIDPETGQQWFVSNDRFDPGFTVGILGEWSINRYVALRFLPTMHFGTKHLTFREQATGDLDYQEIKSTYVSFPLDLKFNALRNNNYRPYFIAGINPIYDLTIKDQDNMALKPFNFMLEVGFGCDRYLPFFKLIPELKFCFGLGNILKKDRSNLQDKTKEIFTKSVDNSHMNMMVLTLYFE